MAQTPSVIATSTFGWRYTFVYMSVAMALNMGIETIAYSGAIAFGIILVTAFTQFFATYEEKFRKDK